MARSTASFWDKRTPYEKWMESLGVPIHRGYYIEDCRTVELGYWPERECDAAFIQLARSRRSHGRLRHGDPAGENFAVF